MQPGEPTDEHVTIVPGGRETPGKPANHLKENWLCLQETR